MITSLSNFDVKDITFSEPKSSGKYEKIKISKSDGNKLIIETEECFSWGVQKSELYSSYSMPLVFKNGDQTVRVLEEIVQGCKDHTFGSTKAFGQCYIRNSSAGPRPYTRGWISTKVNSKRKFLKKTTWKLVH